MTDVWNNSELIKENVGHMLQNDRSARTRLDTIVTDYLSCIAYRRFSEVAYKKKATRPATGKEMSNPVPCATS